MSSNELCSALGKHVYRVEIKQRNQKKKKEEKVKRKVYV